MTDLTPRSTLRFPPIVRSVVFSLVAALCTLAHADNTSNIVKRDGKYYLYRDGKPLTAGYDDMSIDKNKGYPDLAIARQGDFRGLLDAQTGKVLLPVEYRGVDTDTLTRFGLVEVRKDNAVRFVRSDGQPSNVPDYAVVGDFSLTGNGVWKGLAERGGKLYVVTLSKGRFVSESPAPKYLPIVFLPPGLRQAPMKRDGPLNGVYVPAAYPDLKAAWAAWKRGELLEPGQPAIAVRGDIAYVSFGEFANAWMPSVPNTLRSCQTHSGLELRDQDQAGGCTSKAPALFRFVRDGGGALRCVGCNGSLPVKWIALPSVTRSLVGIGVGFEKKPSETAARVVSILPGGPAAQAKLLPGDLVTGVGGESIASLSAAQVAHRIRGKAGTSVTLDVVRGSRQFSVNIERRKIDVSADAVDAGGR